MFKNFALSLLLFAHRNPDANRSLSLTALLLFVVNEFREMHHVKNYTAKHVPVLNLIPHDIIFNGVHRRVLPFTDARAGPTGAPSRRKKFYTKDLSAITKKKKKKPNVIAVEPSRGSPGN